jgi:DNA replication protein DnaC
MSAATWVTRSGAPTTSSNLFALGCNLDPIIKVAVKRTHEPQKVVGDLLQSEIAEKQARSIKYQITIAKLPLAKDVAEFVFAGTPINETLVRELAGGEFLAHQRNVVLVGGTGTGKTHLAIAIARACIRDGARGRFFNVVDLVNRLEAEGRAGRPGPHRRLPLAHGLHRARRTRLSPLRPIRRAAPVPPHQPPL